MRSCERVDRWLDEGRLAAGEAECLAHAASCARCAAAIDAALEIESGLAAAPAPAPTALTGRVMTRVALAHRAEWRLEPPAFEWWVRAAAEPAVALALALAALLMWRGDALVGLASQGLTRLGAALAAGVLAAAPSFEPATRGALWLTLLLLAPWASWLLFRWSESIAQAGIGGNGHARVS